MGINRETLIRLIRELIENPLNSLGYIFNEDKFDFENGCFGFYKKSDDLGLFLYLHFQPEGFNLNELFDLYVNLIRTNISDLHESEPTWIGTVEKIWARMDPILFHKGYLGPEWKWHFVTEDEARFELNDVYKKIVQYGVPFLEDPNSTIDLIFGENKI